MSILIRLLQAGSAAMCLKLRTKPRELDGKANRRKLFEQGEDIPRL